MAVTDISSIYEPLTFAERIDEASVELDAFIQSGVLVDDALLTAQASAGGRIGEIANFEFLTQTAPNISSDDPSSHATPQAIAGQKQIWRLAALNQSWSVMDLARELALKDPVAAITNKIGGYWAIERQRRLIQACIGIYNDNVTAADDMYINIATDAALPVAAAELISPAAVMDAQQTAGDHMGMFTAIAMHSVVFTSLKKQQVIDYISPAGTPLPYPTYLGMRVIVDDMLPVTTGTNRKTYTTILFAAGAFSRGQGVVNVPSEMIRIPTAGTGGGQESIFSRISEIHHPWGFSFVSGSVAGDSATLAELALAANWNQVYHRKNIGLAFLLTNG